MYHGANIESIQKISYNSTTNNCLKMGRKINMHFSEKKMSNGIMKNAFQLLSGRKTKTKIRSHLTTMRMAYIKKARKNIS